VLAGDIVKRPSLPNLPAPQLPRHSPPRLKFSDLGHGTIGEEFR
jgi:hypothetical protein